MLIVLFKKIYFYYKMNKHFKGLDWTAEKYKILSNRSSERKIRSLKISIIRILKLELFNWKRKITESINRD